jgi:HEAT repeat protein
MGLKKSSQASLNTGFDGEEKRDAERTNEQLIEALCSSNSQVRRWAVRDLIGHENAHHAFIERLPNETESSVIEALFDALGHNLTQQDSMHVLAMLKSENVQLRNGAIELMQHSPDHFAANVDTLMREEDVDTRIFCVDIIGAVPHPKALDWLHQIALNDDNENVVGSALDKLAEISDQSTKAIISTIESRFPNHAYIAFVSNLIREQLRET